MKRNFLVTAIAFALCAVGCKDERVETRWAASQTPEVQLYSIDDEGVVTPVVTIVRGTEIEVNLAKREKVEGKVYYALCNAHKRLFIAEANVAEERYKAVKEGKVFVRTPAAIIGNRETSEIITQAGKGESLVVVDYDTLYADGKVGAYRVRKGRHEGYIYAKYTLLDSVEAVKNYKAEVYDKVHSAIKNPFGGGAAIGCDFYPVKKPSFEDNVMPEACYGLYLNISPSVIGNIERYIKLAKMTRINTFVIDIKDNECPGYKAEAMKKYSPTNYSRAGVNKEKMYQTAVKRLHEEGFYVVGRITCFKDSYFVKDHPETAITERSTGKPFKHNKAYWPSAYDRRVWQFNVELAKEAVRKFGFNEINFDYVRFPDRMTKVENLIDYHNVYNESKVQAIQRFVQYACDEIHALGAYVSIDVFGESANPGYTTAYGQYWPALSNIADVMCGMPYPDHFSNHYYGIAKPWNHPYEILKAWGERVQDRQAVTPTPARVRTWVQAYNVMRHVDRNGIAYDAENVEKEIRGLYAAGLTGGYMPWNASSNIEKYYQQMEAFKIDYLSEYRKKNK